MCVPRVTPSHPTLVFTPFSVVSVGPSHARPGQDVQNGQKTNQGLVTLCCAACNPTLLGEIVGSNAKSLSMLININLSQIKVPVFCCGHIGAFCHDWNMSLIFVSSLSNSFITAKAIPEQ